MSTATVHGYAAAAAARHLEQRWSEADAQQAAYVELRDRFHVAVLKGPHELVDTPAFKQRHQTVSAVVEDMVAGNDADHMGSLLSIVGRAAKGEDVSLSAQLCISVLANQHAKFHAAEYAEVMA